MLSLFGSLGALILVLISWLYNRQFAFHPISDHFDFENGTCYGIEAGYDSIFCLCNATFCDTLPTLNLTSLGSNSVITFTSSRDGLRLKEEVVSFLPESSKADAADDDFDAAFHLDGNNTFQTILGFGGAFTDAAGINFESLTNITREKLLRSYFGKDGVSYTVGRVPMASTDFSTRCYSYAEEDDDFDLKSFQLVDEDLRLKIPYILWAKELSEKEIKFFGSPWSPPTWMKSNGHCAGYGRIKGDPSSVGEEGKFYRSWARYFIKFLEEYEKRNITFWGLTAQNEPTDGYIPFFSFNCLGFTAKEQRDFIKFHLGPLLKKNISDTTSSYSKIKLMILDDNRIRAWNWVNTVLGDKDARNYVDGTAIHWYWNSWSSASVTSDVHRAFPDKFILATEACDGWMPLQHKVWLGDWSRAEDYAHSIVEDLNNWVTGWTDWNLALDMQGGPNWAENFVDAPIIVNRLKDEFYRQPMFYVLGHFSKFIPPDSVVIETKASDKNVKNEGFAISYEDEKNGGVKVLVIHNRSEAKAKTLVADSVAKKKFVVEVPPKAIQTLVWKS